MKTIRLLISFALTITCLIGFASNSKISQVTVYRQGAKISRTAKINLKAGNQEVILDNLTSSIDINSLQVVIRGNATLLSASVRNNFVGYQTLPKRTKELKDSLELISDRISWLNNEQAIYQGEEKLVVENQKIVNEKEKISATDIAQLADFYRSRLFSLRKKIFDNNIIIKKASERKRKIEQQLQELNYKKGRQMGEVVLNISATQATQISVNFTYLSYTAGWSPIYDIRCLGTENPLDLVYKANVYQSTGYDWSGIDLVISTGNPTANNNRPIMNPWYINYFRPRPVVNYGANQKAARVSSQMSTMNMMVADAEPSIEIANEAPPVPYQVLEVSNQMTTEYKIKAKQDIPADGKEHIVAIRNIELPAAYSYHTVPKLDQHAFLLARIGDYGQYDLLPGNSNIFFEGMYVGQTYLNPEATGDSLILSMGRDDRISIKRNMLTDLTSTKVVGTNKKVVKAYEVIVRNNKKTALNIEILDQVPIPQNKEIEVEIDEMAGAEYNADYGKLLWRVDLAPAETKKIRYTYSVKYPKDQQIKDF